MQQSCLYLGLPFTEKKHQRDPDDDSGMGPSTFTDTKSTNFSDVRYYLIHVVLCSHPCIYHSSSTLGPSGQKDDGNRL